MHTKAIRSCLFERRLYTQSEENRPEQLSSTAREINSNLKIKRKNNQIKSTNCSGNASRQHACRSPQKHNNQMKTYVTSSGRHIASGFDLLRLFTHETRAHRRISCFLKTRYTRDVTASGCLEQPETTSDKTQTKSEIIFRDYNFFRRPQDFRLEKC